MATAQVIAVDETGAEQPGIVLSPRRPVAADRRVLLEIDHDAEAISTLKVAGPIAIFFLAAYGAVVVFLVGEHGLTQYHYAAFAIITLFFGLTWLSIFRRYWKAWTLTTCVTIIALFIRIASLGHNPELAFIAIILCPFATAAFVMWGPRWQGMLNLGCLAMFGAAELAVPSHDQYTIYRSLGFAAALVLSWFTAVFLDRYRGKLRAQMEQLAAAAKFRERQIGTMTHDIRNPLATLVGLVTLLEEDELSEKETTHLLARVGSTSRAMDLLVKNVLDMYLLEEDNLQPHPRVIDPNVIVQEVADVYGREARLKGLRMRTELGGMPRGSLDPLHLERIVANLLSNGIQRTESGEVVLRTFLSGGKVIIEVQDTGPQLSHEQFSHLFERPIQDRQGMGSMAWKLYIARALTETNGGTVSARSHTNRGLTLITEVPFWEP
ncbi:MAG TPA: HAMP domain-containing sensor histidine kinase [Candidatus Binataceae bacterium]|jgi:signal transduction histidine kinase|nr:HAMP domain-containing sensor histidine kinase [Candidatus Binataceae bacterium]